MREPGHKSPQDEHRRGGPPGDGGRDHRSRLRAGRAAASLGRDPQGAAPTVAAASPAPERQPPLPGVPVRDPLRRARDLSADGAERLRGRARSPAVPEDRLRVAGVHTGRIEIRTTGSFNIQTPDGKVQGVPNRHCRLLQRGDGSGYAQEVQP